METTLLPQRYLSRKQVAKGLTHNPMNYATGNGRTQDATVLDSFGVSFPSARGCVGSG